MRKFIVILLIFFEINLFAQQNTVKDFLINESLAIKIENISKFIDNSETIRYNNYDDYETLFIIIYPYNVDIVQRKDTRNPITKGLFNINIDNGNNIPEIFEKDNCYTYKIDDKKSVAIFLDENEKKYFIKEKYFNNKCKDVFQKPNSKLIMPKNIFNFLIDEYGLTYLFDIGTYDALEYLRLEFLDK